MMKPYSQSQQGCFSSFSYTISPLASTLLFSEYILYKSGISPNSEPLPYPGERSHTPVIPTPPPLFFFYAVPGKLLEISCSHRRGLCFHEFLRSLQAARRSMLVCGEMEAVFSDLSMSRDHMEYKVYFPRKVHCQSIRISTKMLTN